MTITTIMTTKDLVNNIVPRLGQGLVITKKSRNTLMTAYPATIMVKIKQGSKMGNHRSAAQIKNNLTTNLSTGQV
jgi:hypothetical protein